ncbi:16S rRNA (guanine(966)-N(2))-methyltransferase RsmD [Kutzneria kofuensis]|uniref:16S rRNA (Guanine966-N2)-methyltransferase n=1 Tax=Kutzneria kofuensis TaxID=103725 RepID=A0A7W9NI05_9PSEU|nr:16S rRNA (guanine(966)-N(2))-methyltransferase RsmD [Kutzneria kofuensis]MBB5894067.1 16S rRNA (guanine966-N2)-methyltransferase [Kutzneria kofuensis]
MTRIVAGAAGGRRLEVPPSGTRPTSDRVREALFSALEAAVDLDGARVLDLYAGSGALGLEALSRGATKATFVESDRRAADILRRNTKALGLPGADVRHGTVQSVLATTPGDRYDVIFVDPPYALGERELGEVLEALRSWAAEEATLVVERSSRGEDPSWPEGVEPIRSKKYGETTLHWAVITATR